MHEFESREDYLERILILKQRLGNVRSIDIVNDMGFSKPSVSIAMKKLKDSKLIDIDDKGFISLTKQGEEIARSIYERHVILTELLIKIGVDEKTAQKDACLIEHDLSEATFDKIKEFINK